MDKHQECSKNTPSKAIFCYQAFLTGKCQLESCQYAHNPDELIPLPAYEKNLYQCVLYMAGSCPLSANSCNFAHGPTNLRQRPRVSNAKTHQKKHFIRALNTPEEILLDRDACVPDEIKKAFIDLMVFSDGLHVSELPKIFFEKSGYEWDYRSWGFDNLTESLSTLNDVVKIEEKNGLLKLFIIHDVYTKILKKKEELPPAHRVLEDEHQKDDFTPLDDDSDNSYFLEWANEQDGDEGLILYEQLMCFHKKLKCPVCTMVITRQSMLLPCGCLYCRICGVDIVDRVHFQIKCIQCKDKIWKYHKSCREFIQFVHTKSYRGPLRKLAKVIESIPIRCIKYGCDWKGNIQRYRRHKPYCSLIRRAGGTGFYLEGNKLPHPSFMEISQEDFLLMNVKEVYHYKSEKPIEVEDAEKYKKKLTLAIQGAREIFTKKSSQCVRPNQPHDLSIERTDTRRRSSRRQGAGFTRRYPIDYTTNYPYVKSRQDGIASHWECEYDHRRCCNSKTNRFAENSKRSYYNEGHQMSTSCSSSCSHSTFSKRDRSIYPKDSLCGNFSKSSHQRERDGVRKLKDCSSSRSSQHQQVYSLSSPHYKDVIQKDSDFRQLGRSDESNFPKSRIPVHEPPKGRYHNLNKPTRGCRRLQSSSDSQAPLSFSDQTSQSSSESQPSKLFESRHHYRTRCSKQLSQRPSTRKKSPTSRSHEESSSTSSSTSHYSSLLRKDSKRS